MWDFEAIDHKLNEDNRNNKQKREKNRKKNKAKWIREIKMCWLSDYAFQNHHMFFEC